MNVKHHIHYIGIDVSKADFYACLNDTDTPRKFNNTRAGIQGFIKHILSKGYTPCNTFIGLESTGPYHLLLSMTCREAGYKVKVINPIITSKQNKATIRKVKTDKTDSRLIRQCLINGAGYIFTDSAEIIILKNLVRQRNYLSDMKRKMNTKAKDIQYKETIIKQSITSLNQDMFDILSDKIKQLDKTLRQHNKPTQKLLQSIPGLGPLTSVSFVSEIGDITKFNTHKQLTAFIGIDPRTYLSGTSIKGKGYITKRGNKILRTRLFNCVCVAIQRPNTFQTYYNKKITQGKLPMTALVATMHKMTKVIHAVWTKNAPYHEEG
jgi:transposase